MKNSITFSISDKQSINIEFIDERNILNICTLSDLINAGVLRHLIDIQELSDEDLIKYYNELVGLSDRDFGLILGMNDFSLSDINYDYKQYGNKLQISNTLTYKSHDDFFRGNGKFSVDLYAIFILPESNNGKSEVYDFLLTVTAGDNKTWTKALDAIIEKASLVGFDDNGYGYNKALLNKDFAKV